MNLELSDEQTLLQDSVAKLLSQHSTPAHVRAAEATGFDPALWALACEMGIPLLRVPEAQGGMEAGLFEAVLVAEQAGRHLASAPLLDAIVTSRLLAQCGPAGLALLQAQADGTQPVVALALLDVAVQPRQCVPQAGAAQQVLALAGDALVTLPAPPQPPGPAMAHNLAALPLVEADLAALPRTVLLQGPQVPALFQAALEEWKLLVAAAAAAAAQRAIEMAAEYACQREAFGKLIGTYQGLAHPLVDSAVEVDGARLLAWRVVTAMANGEPDAAAQRAMASWWTAETCGRAATRAMRVLGGYGMSLEYDLQLFFRRVNAWTLLAGEPGLELDAVADRLWGPPAPIPLPAAGEPGITFDWDAQAAAHHQQAAAFCAAHDDAELRDYWGQSDDWNRPELYRAMAQAGLLYSDWPKEVGGRGLRPVDAAAIEHAWSSFGWYPLPPGVTNMVGKMVILFATPAAKDEILPRFLAGDCYASLGYSEPSGGSDIFAARTKAVRDGDEWVIDGQKMFTSQGHLADYCLLIARTGPDKHKGITLFIVPLRGQPGYSATEIKTIGHERTNVTFYENLRVHDRYRLGEVNGGVKVLAAALTIEQSGDQYGAALYHLLDNALAWAREPDATGALPLQRPRVRAALAELATRAQVQDVLSRRALWASTTGRPGKGYGQMGKLFGSECLMHQSARLMQLAAPHSLLRGMHPLGRIELEFRRAIPATIYAGTSEVQRSVIGESLLGLPRSR